MLETVPLLQILVCLVIGVLVASVKPLRRPPVLIVLCLAAVIAAYRHALIGYALSSGAVFVFASATQRLSKNRGHAFQWRLCLIGILVLVLSFMAGRWMGLSGWTVRLAGIDWALFSLEMWPVLRFTTFLWEIGSGRVSLPSTRTYVIWACLPFTLLGPVLRYSEFDSQFRRDRWNEPTQKFQRQDLLAALSAIIQLAGAVLLARLHANVVNGGGPAPLWAKLTDAYILGPWGFLLLWGGYFKLMECFAPLWGLRLLPSFNWPFGRANISEFWANWNMTATSVFRDYLFYVRWGKLRQNPYINTMIIFLMVGLWHGLNLYWVLFGLLHGIGFCSFIWYRRKVELKRFEITWIPGKLFGRVFTYVFVCSCWVLPSQILKFFGML